MGLFIGQDEQLRSKLQSKVAADLQQKLHQTSNNEGEPRQPEPKFLENQHETRPAGIIISLLGLVFVILIVYIAITAQV